MIRRGLGFALLLAACCQLGGCVIAAVGAAVGLAANADKLTTQPTPLPSTGLQWLLEKWDDLELE